MFAKDRRNRFIHVGSARPWHRHLSHALKRLRDQPSRLAHHVELARSLELDHRWRGGPLAA
jgi:hypothetical protein